MGSNIGNRKRNMREAVQYMESLIGTVTRQSALYETEPWGFESPNLFINMCVCVETPLAPRQLLEATQEIEKRMGRVGKSENHEYQDRIIDIDILLYDDLTVDEPDLKIPHPLMNEREFVMNPLNEILKKK
ncbi:MAG: 2-amino-4-hydroxy-6-hydroxymethyldihydropteridine diphosphokinase [Prevotella sp.]|nr:2-amino-4-hydroxy-6-hydroxymethyldihydropteridine diphosphokinase [Prevotella sp.]MBP8038036.1 2-amino-4-hydroxy-6-hydroxymethyldihydropteridine diphosphokinase [Prevotella sp.]MBP8757338.1 2-amino-4-hydroxy-6-hydroxymethyldihydropteridine diphosphokinase [Prevotella sp.]MBP9984046.1 2-amino-4-hydroxy-6-hydroxymethyldihydropteridine diphosphokinase [Prevotella sp.]